jgi:hypothetical protein
VKIGEELQTLETQKLREHGKFTNVFSFFKEKKVG